jgi:hypothetical protein
LTLTDLFIFIAINLNRYTDNTVVLTDESYLDKESAVERQSRVAKTGRDWENYVAAYLSEHLKSTGISIVKGDSIPKGSMLWKKLAIPTKASTVEESVWGDIDLVAVKNDVIVAVISCKLSLHGRFTETLFYGVLFRMWSRIKFVLVSPDAGRGLNERWASEWGTPEKPTKDRVLAESYLEGVYIENLEMFCKGKKPTESTCLGGIVRNLAELPEDLLRWAEEDSKFISTKNKS